MKDHYMLSGKRRIRLPCFAMEKRDGGYHESDIYLFNFRNYGDYGWRDFDIFGYFTTCSDHLEDISKDQIWL